MKNTEFKFNLQLFGVPENETINGYLDLLGDHPEVTGEMDNSTVALLVVASKVEDVSEMLYEQLVTLNETLGRLVRHSTD